MLPTLASVKEARADASKQYPARVVRRIAKAGEFPTDDAALKRLRGHLINWASDYLLNLRLRKTRRDRHSKQRLKGIAKSCQELIQKVIQLDDGALDVMAALMEDRALTGRRHLSLADHGIIEEYLFEYLAQVQRSLADLKETSEKASQSKDFSKSGPKRNLARTRAVCDLGLIYQDICGKRPTRRSWPNDTYPERSGEYGPFRDFVIGCLKPIEREDAEKGIDPLLRRAVDYAKKVQFGYYFL